MTIPSIILYESFLSYLGLGIQPPQASLGSLIASGSGQINSIRIYWWLIVFPEVCWPSLCWPSTSSATPCATPGTPVPKASASQDVRGGITIQSGIETTDKPPCSTYLLHKPAFRGTIRTAGLRFGVVF